MTVYQEMYCKLFNKITDVIQDLQQVQQETEKLFIDIENKHTTPIDEKKTTE